MTLIFMATGEIALPTLQWIIDSEHELLAVVTQPDRPAGRSMELRPPAVKVLAEQHNIPVLQPEKIGLIHDELAALAAELHIVMAYGQFLPRKIYEMAPRGCINLHASLLPKYRGASCIQGAIDAGDRTTGITIMHVVQVLDAGNIISAEEIEIGEKETGGELHDRLADLGPQAIENGISQLGQGREQDEAQVSYMPKLERKDGLIDWSMAAEQIERRIRAYHPWPGTFTTFTDPKGKERRLKVFPQTEVTSSTGNHGEILAADDSGLEVACGAGSLRLQLVQPDGKKQMDAGQFSRGGQIQKGAILG